MKRGGRWRWGRPLVMLVALFGVALMHSFAAPMPVDGETATTTEPMALHMIADVVTAAPILQGHGGTGDERTPTPMSHELGHLCLAILGTALMLALAALLLVARRGMDALSRPAAGTGPNWPRPPPRTAVRLAQLCVMRN